MLTPRYLMPPFFVLTWIVLITTTYGSQQLIPHEGIAKSPFTKRYEAINQAELDSCRKKLNTLRQEISQKNAMIRQLQSETDATKSSLLETIAQQESEIQSQSEMLYQMTKGINELLQLIDGAASDLLMAHQKVSKANDLRTILEQSKL